MTGYSLLGSLLPKEGSARVTEPARRTVLLTARVFRSSDFQPKTKNAANAAAVANISGCTSRHLPAKSLMTTNVMNP